MRPGATDPDLWRKALHAGARERVEPNLDHLRATGEPFTAEHRLATRDGQAKWCYHAAVMIRGPDDRRVCVEGILVDITARKKAERVLFVGGEPGDRVGAWSPYKHFCRPPVGDFCA